MNGNPRTFQKTLLAWFEAEARDLPWRRTKDPYRVYLSEIMLQQTRVDQGTPYYERFLERFPTLEALAEAEEEAVLKQWEGLGYYTRARNLHRTARIVMEQYGGRFPESADLLQLLPGIGKYTAGAVASIAFGQRAPVVDGNVKRVLARLNALAEPVDLPVTEETLWTLATALLPSRQPGDFNQAMMELGARICTPKNPACDQCPVCRHCEAYAGNLQASLPNKTAKKAVPQYEVVVAAIYREGTYLIGKRPSAGFLGGLWEFPGGKLRAGETHQQALERECREELGIEITVGGLVAVARHAYTHFKVTLNVYRCTLVSGTPEARAHTELRWVAPEDFGIYPFPKGNHKFLNLL
ncbi:MAG: A/G-specific adenine glycosylase [Candidatus Hydrogenedentes bacterium]|jgi:A/G-specific adenine glycosylase|nr:A/G-specific adenine glycosylase [Candidatus Hydrogenedentota bacterium]